MRHWGGRGHTVLVREDGFEYHGQRYRSLSVIAERLLGLDRSGSRRSVNVSCWHRREDCLSWRIGQLAGVMLTLPKN